MNMSSLKALGGLKVAEIRVQGFRCTSLVLTGAHMGSIGFRKDLYIRFQTSSMRFVEFRDWGI